MYELLREKIKKIIKESNVEDKHIKIRIKKLHKNQAIGNPEHDDYPILKGKEALLQAYYNGSSGVAFTDMPYDNYEQRLSTIVDLELKNNFQRAVFVATLNAILKHLGLIEKTEHCRDEGPVNCASKLKDYICLNYQKPKVLLVGFQPRFAEILTEFFQTRIVDLDFENIGKNINNVSVESADKTLEVINWADLLFVSSSTFVNNTADQFVLPNKKTVFYGVSGAGCTYLLGLERYCCQ